MRGRADRALHENEFRGGVMQEGGVMAERTAYPLCWPEGWKRAKHREHAHFNKTRQPTYNAQGQKLFAGKTRLSVADAVNRVIAELSRMGIKDDDTIISTNVRLRLDGLPRSDQEPDRKSTRLNSSHLG